MLRQKRRRMRRRRTRSRCRLRRRRSRGRRGKRPAGGHLRPRQRPRNRRTAGPQSRTRGIRPSSRTTPIAETPPARCATPAAGAWRVRRAVPAPNGVLSEMASPYASALQDVGRRTSPTHRVERSQAGDLVVVSRIYSGWLCSLVVIRAGSGLLWSLVVSHGDAPGGRRHGRLPSSSGRRLGWPGRWSSTGRSGRGCAG